MGATHEIKTYTDFYSTVGRFGTSVDFVDGSPIVGNPNLDTVSALRYLFDRTPPSIIMYLLN